MAFDWTPKTIRQIEILVNNNQWPPDRYLLGMGQVVESFWHTLSRAELSLDCDRLRARGLLISLNSRDLFVA